MASDNAIRSNKRGSLPEPGDLYAIESQQGVVNRFHLMGKKQISDHSELVTTHMCYRLGYVLPKDQDRIN